MRISEERHQARLRVSKLGVGIEEGLHSVFEELGEEEVTYAEVQLALTQAQSRWAELAFKLETEDAQKKANKT